MPPKKPVFSFKSGHYKTLNPQDYTSIVVTPRHLELDLNSLRAHRATSSFKQGMLVESIFSHSGKYAGQWYDCLLVKRTANGWIVAWADKDTTNTRKQIMDIRLKRSCN